MSQLHQCSRLNRQSTRGDGHMNACRIFESWVLQMRWVYPLNMLLWVLAIG